MKNFDARLDRIEQDMAAKNPRSPIRVVNLIVEPGRGTISAWLDGEEIERGESETEEEFIARVDVWADDGRPLVGIRRLAP